MKQELMFNVIGSPSKKLVEEVILTEAEQEAALKELFSATIEINEADLAEVRLLSLPFVQNLRANTSIFFSSNYL